MKFHRFPFLRYPIHSFRSLAERLPAGVPTKLTGILKQADYPFRLLRYWWAGQALKVEAQRLGRPLVVVDLGCERGWLKHFTPDGAVQRWIGVDWVVQGEVTRLAGYHEVHEASFDEHLPLGNAVADAVVSLHVFEHLPRPGSTMSEISRLLKPGAIFLGGAPTMPQWLAALREGYFRKQLARGQLAVGGHITVLSPHRWRTLAQDAGLQVEFLTGSHLIRHTGSRLENSRWWVRLNQAWGALFPSLGSECYLQARRAPAWQPATDRLAPEDPHWRRLWIGLGAVAVLMFGSLSVWAANHWESRQERQISAWIDAHQTGSDFFLMREDSLRELCGRRPDLECTDSIPELLQLAQARPQAHILVSIHTAAQLAQALGPEPWLIDSRLDLGSEDYLLLKRGTQGTPLQEYLRGAHPVELASRD